MALSTDHIKHVPVKRLKTPPGSNQNGADDCGYGGWSRGDLMTAAKLFAREFAVERAGSDDRLVTNTNWAALGITKETVWRCVAYLIPDLAAEMEKRKPGAKHPKRIISIVGVQPVDSTG